MKPLFKDLLLIIVFSVFLVCFNTAFNAETAKKDRCDAHIKAAGTMSFGPVCPVSDHRLKVGFQTAKQPMSR